MVLAFALSLPAAVLAGSGGEEVKAGLARDFCGAFQWDGSRDVQDVSISLSGSAVDADGRVSAWGAGRYVTAGGTTHIQVKWRIDPESRRFEMWEMHPTQPGFVTDGSHVGSISADLAAIQATWTTRATGEHGTLRLRPCSAATS